MKKFIAVLVLLIGLAGLVLALGAKHWVADQVRGFVADRVLTEVSLAEADVLLFAGRVELRGLSVANPSDMAKGPAVVAPEMVVALEPGSLLGGPLRIEEFTVSGVDIYLQPSESGSNIKRLARNVELAGERRRGGRAAMVDRLVVAGGRLLNAKGELIGPLPTLLLEDVSGTLNALFTRLVRNLARGAAETAALRDPADQPSP